MTAEKIFFDKHGHLNSTGLQIYARAVEEEDLGNLSETVYEHGNTCLICSEKILDLLE